MTYKTKNIPSVFIDLGKSDIEFYITTIGDVIVETYAEGLYDEGLYNKKTLDKLKLKSIIDGLTKIYEGME